MKADVVLMHNAGLISQAEVQRRYDVSADELAEWCRNYARAGIDGLKSRRMQPGRGGVQPYRRRARKAAQ